MSLQIWLPLDNHLHNHGLSSAKFSSANVTYSQGKIGQCASGTISGGINDVSSTTGFTIGLWWKIKAGDSYSVQVPINTGVKSNSILYLNKMDYSNNSPAHYAIKINATNNEPQMIWSRDSRYGQNGRWILDKWFHYVITAQNTGNGLVVKTYVNGELEQTYTSSTYNFSLIPGTITLSGTALMNDFRIYNHCLTLKEISEWSKGLFLHYPLRELDLEGTTNLLPYPTPEGSANHPWNATLHPNAIIVDGFSSGYNGGVSSPATGYHAYWALEDGEPVMNFPDLNTQFGKGHRWLGISSSGTTNLVTAIGSGNQYTLSFEAKSSVDGKPLNCGLHYAKEGTTSKDFHDGKKNFYLTTNWKKYTYTWTLGSSVNFSVGGTFYFYGYTGTIEGILQVRNVQLEVKDHSTGYVNGNRISSTIEDCSGFLHHGTIVGEISIAPDSARHSHCIYQIDGRYNYISSKNIYFPKDAITMSCWVKGNVAGYSSYHIPLSFNSGAYEISLQGDSGIFRAGFNVNGVRQVLTTSGNVTLDNKWHLLVSTYDGSTIRRYVDGKEYASTSAVGSLSGGIGQLLIGNYNGTQYGNKNLYVSDVRIYATALTSNDIQDLYKVGASADKNGLLYGYEFVEADENSIFKTGIVDFSNFIEYNIDESRIEKISIYKDSVDTSNLYEF